MVTSFLCSTCTIYMVIREQVVYLLVNKILTIIITTKKASTQLEILRSRCPVDTTWCIMRKYFFQIIRGIKEPNLKVWELLISPLLIQLCTKRTFIAETLQCKLSIHIHMSILIFKFSYRYSHPRNRPPFHRQCFPPFAAVTMRQNTHTNQQNC